MKLNVYEASVYQLQFTEFRNSFLIYYIASNHRTHSCDQKLHIY